MDGWSLWGALLRRWYAVVLVVVITAIAAGGMFLHSTATYQAVSSYVLVPPVSAPTPSNNTPGPSNPYMDLNSLGPAAQIVASAISSEDVLQAIGERAPGASFDAAADPTANAPILTVTVEGPTAAVVDRAQALLATVLPETFANLQRDAKVSEASLITLRSLGVAPKAQSQTKKRLRLALTAAAASFVLGLLLVVAFDEVLRRRQRPLTGTA